MNEAETRAEHIDPALALAGWGVEVGSRVRREFSITEGRIEGGGKRGKALTADYVLEYKGIKLAVIEAKAFDLPLTEGLAQAKNYAEKLQLRFVYATNGQGVYRVDMHTGAEGELAGLMDGFPTPEQLWELTFGKPKSTELTTPSEFWRDRFALVPYPDKSGSWSIRFYQELAVNSVLSKIAKGDRRVLLTLATGTGKTSIAFQIAWKLFQARWSLSGDPHDEKRRRPRILFLADRNNLADQAKRDFGSFMAFADDAMERIEPSAIKKKGRVPYNANLFFTIFQTFMSGTDDKGEPAPYFGEYPKDFFDLIIIDECHRGGANDEGTWRGILEYFTPAVQLGLTATPKRKDNANTYAYFGEPAFVYSLKDGINDGFLTPFRVKQISTTLDEYVYTPDDTVLDGEVESGRRYVEADFNKIIEIRAREQKRVEIFMGAIDQRQKTIVFCATQAHALAVRDLINQCKTSTDPNYCQRVTANDGALGEQHLKDFQDNEKSIPTILTTSQKLSTGVDARNVRNIVLMRPVNNIIEFKQIIGRGTRLFEGKDYFTIYDFARAYEHFSDPEWDGEAFMLDPDTPPVVIPEPKLAGFSPAPPIEPLVVRERAPKLKIKLADGKLRTIQHMSATSFWHPDGTPMSAAQFMTALFGKLPDFFTNETELRSLWSDPITRKRLLQGLADKGFGKDQLRAMQEIIEAPNSDLFDVLAHVAFALEPLTRKNRADRAMAQVSAHFSSKHQVFLDFVLAHYVDLGVDELELDNLSGLLNLKYQGSIQDALNDLGAPTEINRSFSGFQKYLYEPVST